MVKVIVVKNSGDLINAVQSLNRIKKKLPIMTRLGMRRWGNILVKDMKASAKRAKIRDYTGTLSQKGIRWEQPKKSNEGFLFMRLYSIYLDSMSPHYVSVKRTRTVLLRWAKVARNPRIRRKAALVEKGELKSFGIFVRPHPFIAEGYRRARPKLKPVLKRAAIRGVNI